MSRAVWLAARSFFLATFLMACGDTASHRRDLGGSGPCGDVPTVREVCSVDSDDSGHDTAWIEFESGGDSQADMGGSEAGPSDAGPACVPNTVTCMLGVRRICAVDGLSWATSPCPPGQACTGSGCEPISTVVYLVMDTNFSHPDDPAISSDLLCTAVSEARAHGSLCPTVTPGVGDTCDCAVAASNPEQVCYLGTGYAVPLVASFFARRVLEGLADVPGLRFVMVHPPVRTAVFPYKSQSEADVEDWCRFGYYQPAYPAKSGAHPSDCYSGPVASEQIDDCWAAYRPLLSALCGADGCQCGDDAPGAPATDLLTEMFGWSVVGYPDPWGTSANELRRWVDGSEDIEDTGVPCEGDATCGQGTCSGGSCWDHGDPEIRTWAVGGDMGTVSASPLLYLTAQFIRLEAEAEGRSCLDDADCGVLGAKCSSEGRCHDSAYACRRRHVVLITGSHVMGLPFEANVARWMHTGLGCSTDEDCAAESACMPFPGLTSGEEG